MEYGSRCVSCGQYVSGMGYCDACGGTLCYLCHEKMEHPQGTAVVCPACKEKKAPVATPRYGSKQ